MKPIAIFIHCDEWVMRLTITRKWFTYSSRCEIRRYAEDFSNADKQVEWIPAENQMDR